MTSPGATPRSSYEPESASVVDILEFTDPVCTWCWGAEPVLRALEHRYGDQVRIGFVMGGLVPDIRKFHDSANQIGGDPADANRQIAAHWAEASARHGMPSAHPDSFHLFSADHPSTFPQNIAYKAAQQQDEKLGNRFLRRMREASEAEGMVTSKTAIQVQLAAEMGLDVGRFLGSLNDGSAEKAFEADRRFIAGFGASGFPTFLVRYGGKSGLLPGWQPFETFVKVLDQFTGGALIAAPLDSTDEGAAAFVGTHGRVAPVEVAAALGLSRADATAALDRLVGTGRAIRQPMGNGALYAITSPLAPRLCDPATGMRTLSK